MLDEVEGLSPDAILFGGDIVAGPLPRETLELVRKLDARAVRGNADRPVSTPADAAWVWARLDKDEIRWLETLPLSLALDGVLYCHATPSDDEPLVTLLTRDDLARSLIGEIQQETVVIGHTHSQFDRRLGDLRLVNAGSVGMPYEDAPGAYWALLRDGEPELRRTEYDLAAAAERIRPTGWPPVDEGWIEENLLRVPTAREAAEHFESQRG